MAANARTVVEAFFNAWKNNDFAAMRSVLDDKLDFSGRIDRFDNADTYQQAIVGVSPMKTDIVIQKTFVDGAGRRVEPGQERQDLRGPGRVRRSAVHPARRPLSGSR